MGTDFPLLAGMILAAGLDPASTLILFGAMQVLTGFFYGIPMPAQPLKAMAVLVISQKVAGSVLYGGGLAIGAAMLLLAVTGLIDVVAKAVPKVVVRGIQFGLGLQLASLALKEYVPAEGVAGYGLALAAFTVVLFLLGNRRFPPAPFVILFGVVYAILFRVDGATLASGIGFRLPQVHVPTGQDIWSGLILLALPQIPLSLGNSILATRQITRDLFPHKDIGVRRISFTYAAMNLLNPFFSGVPTCHGSGGMAGHYAFGGRTGGSVVLYGALYLAIGLFFSGSFGQVLLLFPKPVLGTILLFEAVTLMALAKDMVSSPAYLLIVLLVGLMAVNLPYGYLVALVAGMALAYLADKRWIGLGKQS
ncbi:MAG: transporter [Acidobacteria bacterium]|nr:transporter [Acidobacteriota bacterium]